MVLTLILSIPFGFVFQFIKSPRIRDYANIILGFSFQYIVYHWELLFVFGQAVFVYVVVLIAKQKAGRIIIVESVLYLSLHFLYLIIWDYGSWRLDITTILFMTTLKFTAFAFNVSDSY